MQIKLFSNQLIKTNFNSSNINRKESYDDYDFGGENEIYDDRGYSFDKKDPYAHAFNILSKEEEFILENYEDEADYYLPYDSGDIYRKIRSNKYDRYVLSKNRADEEEIAVIKEKERAQEKNLKRQKKIQVYNISNNRY